MLEMWDLSYIKQCNIKVFFLKTIKHTYIIYQLNLILIVSVSLIWEFVARLL